jgi:hypothetical protein
MTALPTDLWGVAAVGLEAQLELMLEHARRADLASDGATIARELDPDPDPDPDRFRRGVRFGPRRLGVPEAGTSWQRARPKARDLSGVATAPREARGAACPPSNRSDP